MKVLAWAPAALKLVAAVLPLLARHRFTRAWWNRAVTAFAWTAAAILTTYGLVYSAGGLLLQAGVLHAPAGANHRAQAWHAYFWDPWFLLWGLLVVAALVLHRRRALSHPPLGTLEAANARS